MQSSSSFVPFFQLVGAALTTQLNKLIKDQRDPLELSFNIKEVDTFLNVNIPPSNTSKTLADNYTAPEPKNAPTDFIYTENFYKIRHGISKKLQQPESTPFCIKDITHAYLGYPQGQYYDGWHHEIPQPYSLNEESLQDQPEWVITFKHALESGPYPPQLYSSDSYSFTYTHASNGAISATHQCDPVLHVIQKTFPTRDSANTLSRKRIISANIFPLSKEWLRQENKLASKAHILIPTNFKSTNTSSSFYPILMEVMRTAKEQPELLGTTFLFYRLTTNLQSGEEQWQESDYDLEGGLFEVKPSPTHEDKASHFGL